MKYYKSCPECGHQIEIYRNPVPTVDIIISISKNELILIKRQNPPYGWALPGGFVDYGESVEQAARREAQEETGLSVNLIEMLGVYSHPDRDPRQHTMSVVFMATVKDQTKLQAGDDAAKSSVFSLTDLPEMAFDHRDILSDYQAKINQKPGAEKVGYGRSICL